MGRLLKKKVDEVAKLRAEGYCQSEVASKVGVSVKSVRKYQPKSYGFSKRQDNQEPQSRLARLEETVRALRTIALSYYWERGDDLVGWCDACDNTVTIKLAGDTWQCSHCHKQIPNAGSLNCLLTGAP